MLLPVNLMWEGMIAWGVINTVNNIGIRVFIFPIRSKIHTFYFGCLPLFTNIFWFWFGPIMYDILPVKKDKTNTLSYNKNNQMFIDKYKTQIPNSPLFDIHNKRPLCEEEQNTDINDIIIYDIKS